MPDAILEAQNMGICPGYGNGKLRFSPAVSAGAGTIAGTAGSIQAAFFPHSSGSFNQALIECTALPSPTVGRMTIWDNSEDGLPAGFLREADAEVALAVSTAGVVWTFASGFRSGPRGFWMGFILSASGTLPTLRSGSTGQSMTIGNEDFTSAPRRGMAGLLTYPIVAGGFPPSFPSPLASGVTPLIGIRKI